MAFDDNWCNYHSFSNQEPKAMTKERPSVVRGWVGQVPAKGPPSRLDSWKEIGEYLGRDVRTAIRWEQERGLPVHRVPGDRKPVVFALSQEIDAWLAGAHPAGESSTPGALEPEWASDGPKGIQPGAVSRGATGTRRYALATAAATLALVSAALLRAPASRHDERRLEVIRLSLAPPPGHTFAAEQGPSLSPDGTRVALVAVDREGRSSIWIRRLDSPVARAIPGTEGASFPFWSPDGRQLAFFSEVALKKVDIDNGAPTVLSEATGRGGSWGEADVIVFGRSPSGPLYRVSSGGGLVSPATSLDPDRLETSHRWPHFLPDGRRFLFFVASTREDESGVRIAALDRTEGHPIVNATSSAIFVPPDSLLFLRGHSLFVQRALGDPFQTSGPTMLAADYVGSSLLRESLMSASATVLVYRGADDAAAASGWVDRSGSYIDGLHRPNHIADPCLLADGTAVVARPDPTSGRPDIWRIDSRDGSSVRLTSHPASDFMPLCPGQGDSIVFASNRSGHVDLYSRKIEAGADEEPLLLSDYDKFPEDWSPDGKFIAFNRPTSQGGLDIWMLPLGTNAPAFPYRHTPYSDGSARFAPNGGWVAYVSAEKGRPDVFVDSFPTPTANPHRVSAEGGCEPQWTRGGRELLYLASDGTLVAADVTTGGQFSVVRSRALFKTGLDAACTVSIRNHYAVPPDGSRILLVRPSTSARDPFQAIVNWRVPITP